MQQMRGSRAAQGTAGAEETAGKEVAEQCMTSPSLASWHHGHRILHRDPPRHPRHRSVDSVDSATRAEEYIYTGAPKSLEVLKSSGKYIRKDKVVLKLRENGQNYK